MKKRPEPGARVKHDELGEGTVLEPTPHTAQAYSLVEFDLSGRRLRVLTASLKELTA